MKGSKKWYQSASNWIIIVGCIILIPLLAINLYIMFQSKINQDKVPSVFGIKPFMVLSGSMESEINKGDLILTRNVDPNKLKAGDIIAFRDADGTVTTHRIIDLVEESGFTYFITKGDNNNTQDQNLVSFSDVEGIYVARIAGIGSIMNTLSEPTTIIILLLAITVIFVIGFGISNKKQRDLDHKEFLEYKMQKEELARKELENKKKEELIEAINKAVVLEEQEPSKKTTPKVALKTPSKRVTPIKEEEPTPAKRKPGRPKKEEKIKSTGDETKTRATKKASPKKSKASTTIKTSTATKKKTTTNSAEKATPKKNTSSAKKNTTTKSTSTATKKSVGRPKKTATTENSSKLKTTRTKKTK